MKRELFICLKSLFERLGAVEITYDICGINQILTGVFPLETPHCFYDSLLKREMKLLRHALEM